MKTEDLPELLRAVSGPIAMCVASIAALFLDNPFAAAVSAVAAIGWSEHVKDTLERRAAVVHEVLGIVDDALAVAKRQGDVSEIYADKLTAERLASDAVAEHFYKLGRADTCERVNKLLAQHGSPLRVTSPDDHTPN